MFSNVRSSFIPERLRLRYMRKRDEWKLARRQLFRFLKNPPLAGAYSSFRAAVDRADWPAVRSSVIEVARIARETGDRKTMLEMVWALDRVGCHQESGNLWLHEQSLQPKKIPNEWRGEELSGKKILINLNQAAGGGLGVGYRCVPIIPVVMRMSREVKVILEPRQVATFRRTFPGLDVTGTPDGIDTAAYDFVAFPAALLGKFGASHFEEFRPLLADPALVKKLREKYRAQAGGRPLVGLCWYSGHHGKDLPALQHWRDFVARTDARFVSLQYGDVSRDVAVLGPDRVIVDETINQLADMDSFAAQICALDGVITIMNTLVHVGGALNAPTAVLRDDWFRRDLPVLSDRIPWFPSLRVAGRNRREWPPVLDDAFALLKASGAFERSGGA